QSEQKESIRRRMIQTATLVAISVQELRRLITHLQTARPPDLSFRWMWSIWRRRSVTHDMSQIDLLRRHYLDAITSERWTTSDWNRWTPQVRYAWTASLESAAWAHAMSFHGFHEC